MDLTMLKFFKQLFSRFTTTPTLTEKEIKTQRGEAYVSVVAVEVDSETPDVGSFTLDWNDKFVADLVRAGYMQNKNDTDAMIVERWFNQVIRNVLSSNFENELSDPLNREIMVRAGSKIID
jgi:hypothetical protein